MYLNTSFSYHTHTAAARYTVGIEPLWPHTLHEKTSFSAEDIADCMAAVVAVFCR